MVVVVMVVVLLVVKQLGWTPGTGETFSSGIAGTGTGAL